MEIISEKAFDRGWALIASKTKEIGLKSDEACSSSRQLVGALIQLVELATCRRKKSSQANGSSSGSLLSCRSTFALNQSYGKSATMVHIERQQTLYYEPEHDQRARFGNQAFVLKWSRWWKVVVVVIVVTSLSEIGALHIKVVLIKRSYSSQYSAKLLKTVGRSQFSSWHTTVSGCAIVHDLINMMMMISSFHCCCRLFVSSKLAG